MMKPGPFLLGLVEGKLLLPLTACSIVEFLFSPQFYKCVYIFQLVLDIVDLDKLLSPYVKKWRR